MCVLLVFGAPQRPHEMEKLPIIIGTGMFQNKCMAFNVRKQTMTFARGKGTKCPTKVQQEMIADNDENSEENSASVSAAVKQ